MGNNNTIEELQSILDLIPYEITLKKVNGDYLYANREFFQCINGNYNEVFGKNMAMFFNEQDFNIIKKLDQEVLEKNIGIFSERKLRSFTKDERWFSIYKAPVIINDEKCVFTLSQEITFDKKITNLMAYELEKDSHDLLGYQDILYDEKSSDKVSDEEYKNRITILCRNLCDELGASYIDILIYDEENNDLNLYICTCEENRCKNAKVNLGKNEFLKFTDKKITIDYEMLYNLYKSNIFELKINEIRYGNNIIGLMNIYYEKNHDINTEHNDLIKSTCYKFGLLFQNKITSRKHREEQQKSLEYKNALEMERIKTDFFSSISHEFRTPLNIITTAIQLINSVIVNCECETYKEIISKNINHIKLNSNRLIRLLNNIIDVNKITAGYSSAKLTNCNIVEVIEDIVLSVADYISTSGRNVIFDTEEEEVIMACDIDKIERIMLNLLSNAIKYGYENTDILVKMYLDNKRNEIVVSVWDDGVSIDQKDNYKIFQKYVQLHKLFNRPCEGSGIGLFLVKSFVEVQGGKVWVNYNVKKGTEFVFSIPVKIIEDKKVVHYSADSQKKVEICNVEFSDIYSL